MFNKFLPPLTV